MDDKRLRAELNSVNQKLTFTKEDRHKVFEQIRKIDEKSPKQKLAFTYVKKFAPVTASILVVGLCLFLFLPSILSGNFNDKSNAGDINELSSTIVASNPVEEEQQAITTLITVKSKEMDNQIYLNLLLTYNKEKKMLKVVSPSHFTYAPVSENDDGTTLYDRLLIAYQFGGAKNVKVTVSKLFDLPIDHYAVLDLETFSDLIDAVHGIDYDLQEAIRVRAITQVAFEFEKGIQHLNGEEVVALMMSVSEWDGLGEEHLVNLLNVVISNVQNEIPSAQLKQLFAEIESNVSMDALVENKFDINSIKSISLKDGMITDSILLSNTTGKFFYKFEEDFLPAIVEELTTFE